VGGSGEVEVKKRMFFQVHRLGAVLLSEEEKGRRNAYLGLVEYSMHVSDRLTL
jgi:hypothetical protein